MNTKPPLLEVDGVEVITIVDNIVDALLEGNENVERAPMIRGDQPAPPLIAEHGFAAIVRVNRGGERHSILLDTGLSETTMLANADQMGIDFKEIEAVVISHGHIDHIKGLMPAMERFREGIPVVIHPHGFSQRIIKIPDGRQVRMTPLDSDALERAGAQIIRSEGPSLIANDTVLVTGQIPRVTEFEFGFPLQYAVVDGEERHDPLTPDDQSLVVAVRGRGLVVISGCAHAGIVNTLYYARELTGQNQLYAVIGGFHLAGPLYESTIEPTVDAIEKLKVSFLLPTHCTGWKAIHEFARRMPDAFIQNSVGTRLILGNVVSTGA